MTTDLIGLISVMIVTLGGWGTTIIKNHYDKKESLKELSNRDKILASSLRGMEVKLTDIDLKVDDIKNENEFERILTNAIKSKGSQVVNISYALSDACRNILMFMTGQINDFAFHFYYSPYRNNPVEQKKYLHSFLDERRAHVKTFINNSSTDIKVVKNKHVILSEFLAGLNIFRHVELLSLDLERNGLEKKDVIERFTEFTDKLLEETIKGFTIFDNLDDKPNT